MAHGGSSGNAPSHPGGESPATSTHAPDLDFQEIYAAYQPRVLRYLARLAGELEAEDLTQEVFLKINQGLKSFRGEAQLSTWIYRIATNAAIDKMRSAAFKASSERGLPDDLEAIEDQDVWTEEVPALLEQQLMRKEMYQCFEDFLQQLPANYRTVFVLSEFEGLTNQEIAEILGLSLGTVKIRLHRGRTRLFEALKAYCKSEDWL
jgi:RNA polymerase sigma-70 factor (ECF subfamily)